eukprot:5030974-Pleurochrysis_carterae.AAC.1
MQMRKGTTPAQQRLHERRQRGAHARTSRRATGRTSRRATGRARPDARPLASTCMRAGAGHRKDTRSQ